MNIRHKRRSRRIRIATCRRGTKIMLISFSITCSSLGTLRRGDWGSRIHAKISD